MDLFCIPFYTRLFWLVTKIIKCNLANSYDIQLSLQVIIARTDYCVHQDFHVSKGKDCWYS